MNLKKKVEAWASALFRGVGCVLGVRSQLYHLSAGSREAVQDKHAHVEIEQLQCPLEEDLSLAHDKGIILSDSSGKAVDVARDKLDVL